MITSAKEDTGFKNFFLGPLNIVKKIDTRHLSLKSDSEIKNLEGHWAIVVKDLKSGKSYYYNQNEKFLSASLYKLAVMWATFAGIEKGTLKKDAVLSESVQVLDQALLGNQETEESQIENSQNQDETVTMTVEEALRAAITVSDNYAAILLAQKLDWNNIDKLMEAENLSNLDITDPPTITAQAATDLLERIYKSQAVSTGASIEMKNLLLSQSINDRIPKYLPKGTKVAHKTGELEWVKHDVGIVYGKKSDYIFVFLSETNSPKDAAETIANLSRKIFDELEARQS